MYRQQISSEAIQQDRVVLEGDQAHHLLHVLRVTEGAEVGAFDGVGHTRLYHVATCTATTLELEAKQPVFDAGKTVVETVICI